MSNLFKSVVLVLTVGIFLTTFISQKEATAGEEKTATQEVTKLENDIDSGLVINDGILVEDEKVIFKKDDSNFISSTTSKVGSSLSSIITKVLKFFANIISKLLS